MTDDDAGVDAVLPSLEELEAYGVYDPDEPDAEKTLGLVRFLLLAGASLDEVRAASARGGLGAFAVEAALRAAGDRRTIDEVAREVGLERSDVFEFLGTMGLPASGDLTLGTAESEAIRLYRDMSALIGKEATLEIVRVAGSSLARIAEAVVAAFRVNFHVSERRAGRSSAEMAASYGEIGRAFLPPFAQVLDAAFRRHLALGLYGAWDVDAEVATSLRELCVGFVDLVGFTSLSAAATPASLAATLRAFEARVSLILSRNESRLVKLIGDEAMFVSETQEAGLRTASDLLREFDGDASLPPVRVGLAYGTVLAARGDYFGEPVNLAARLVSGAEPSTALVPDGMRCLVDGDAIESAGSRELKGFTHPVAVAILRASRPSEHATPGSR